MDTLFPRVEEGKHPAGAGATRSVMTSVGLVEGDILTYLDEHGATSLRHLIRVLEWPSAMVLMGIGALIRTGMVRGLQRELEVLIEPITPLTVRGQFEEPAPEVWGE